MPGPGAAVFSAALKCGEQQTAAANESAKNLQKVFVIISVGAQREPNSHFARPAICPRKIRDQMQFPAIGNDKMTLAI